MPQNPDTPHICVLDTTRLRNSWDALWSPDRDKRKTLAYSKQKSFELLCEFALLLVTRRLDKIAP
jgi:hypothetical protein